MAPTTKRTDALLLIVLILGRAIFLLASPAVLSGDASSYVGAADTLITTGRLPPLSMQPRGLPLLISPLLFIAPGRIAQAVLLMNVIMDTAVIAALAVFAWRLFPKPHPRWVRFLACVGVILQPFTAEMVSSIHTEQASQFFVFFGVCVLVRFRSNENDRSIPIVGPLLLGVAALLRVDLLPLNLFLVVASLWLRRESFGHLARKVVFGVMVYGLLPLSMLAFQYQSSRELGFVGNERIPSMAGARLGYAGWFRTWFASYKEYEKLAFDAGTPNWEGFDPANYPDRAFDTAEERAQVARLLASWRASGYTEYVAGGFSDLARQRVSARPLYCYVLLPVMRMLHFWINFDGAQTILRVITVHRPLSTVLVGITVLLRLVLLCLAVVGTFFVWRKLSAAPPYDRRIDLGRVSTIVVALRTLELGILGMFFDGGLMEVRYILVAFPFLIVLALFGTQFMSATYSRVGPRQRDSLA